MYITYIEKSVKNVQKKKKSIGRPLFEHILKQRKYLLLFLMQFDPSAMSSVNDAHNKKLYS